MTEAKAAEQHVTGVRTLALLLAGLLWLAVTVERPGELTLLVPVSLVHLPPGLQLASAPPGLVQVTVSGPRILLFGVWMSGGGCLIDVSGAGPGPASFSARDCHLSGGRELKVVRVQPETLQLSFAKAQPR